MYKIVGADGRQYGPVSEDQIRRWLAEGRANAQTQVLAEGAMEWKALGVIPEFATAFAPKVPPALTPVSGSHLRTTNAFAMTGMILGILAMLCCCLKIIFGPLGLIFSLIGLSQINARPDIYDVRGMAIAGIILSALSLLVALLMIFFSLFASALQPNQWPIWH
jgi:hypothetical protein